MKPRGLAPIWPLAFTTATGTYTLSIDPLGAGGGFSVGTDAGTLVATDANTKILSGEVVHADAFSMAPAGNIGDWSYSFDLMAPATASTTITLSFTGMALDGGFNDSKADVWNTGAFMVSVILEPGTGLLLSLGLGALALAGRRRRA